MKDEIVRQIISPSAELQFDTADEPGLRIVRCRGAFSLVNHDKLDRVLETIKSAGNAKVILELSNVAHVDSVGVGTLAVALKDSLASRRKLVLVANDLVKSVLATSSLDTAFHIADSLDAARSM